MGDGKESGQEQKRDHRENGKRKRKEKRQGR